MHHIAIEWGGLRAVEPLHDEVLAHVLVETDVVEHYEQLAAHGKPFLLFHDGVLAGDGDIRSIGSGAAEFAFLIASPNAQGKGLGTRFATMIHAFAFAYLPIARMYAAVVPQNVASRRVFEKLGYVEDASEAARAFGDAGDVTLSIDRKTFAARNAAAIAEIRITGAAR
ncbi:MAG: GNAT family N-acetyltransferase [Kofleriaceae bacterium]